MKMRGPNDEQDTAEETEGNIYLAMELITRIWLLSEFVAKFRGTL
jgi:hypothetical protein